MVVAEATSDDSGDSNSDSDDPDDWEKALDELSARLPDLSRPSASVRSARGTESGESTI